MKIKTVLFFLLIPVILSAQFGGVQGVVQEEGKALSGVNVFIPELAIGAATDDEGFYQMRDIPVGNYFLRFSAVGFETKNININIEANRILELNISLEFKAIEVEQVEVLDKGVQDQKDTRVSLIQVKPEEAKILPGAVTDVFRTLQALPGVLAPNDFSSQLIIRGSSPDQNLIIMDDVEIFNPYRLYGVISMFNPEAVSDINLVTGGFSSKYGDRLSAVLDVTNRQGDRSRQLSGNVNASIVSANVVLEGRNPFDIPGSWLLNSRRTYYDLIVEPFVKNAGLVEENTSFPNFYDIQAKLTFGPFDGHKFFLNGILSTDGVEIISGKQRTTADSIGAFNVTDNDLAAFAWHYAPSKNLLNKVILSWYKNEGDADFDSRFLDPSLNREDFEEVSTDTLAPYLFGFGFDSKFIFQKYSLEDKFLFFWGTGNEFEAGVGMDFIRTDMKFQFTFDPALQNFINSNPNTRSAFEDIISTKKYNRYRAYINNKFLIGDRIALEPGIRFDHFNIINKGYFSPRVSLSYGLDNLTTLRAQWGIYYQSPGYEKLRDRNILFDFSPKNMVNVEAEFATHYVLGIERWVNSEWKVKLEGYFKDFDDLILPRMETGTGYFTEAVPGVDPKKPEGWTRPVPIQADSLTQFPVNQSQGEAYGIEFLLEKRNISGDNKINGWLSYAYSVAERVEYGRTVPFRFDQRHTLNLVFNYKINDWLDFGARFQYGSGFPYTEPVGVKPRILEIDTNGDFIPDSPEIATRKVSFDSDIRNVIYDVDYGGEENRYRSRRPIYHRLDLRLTAAADYWDLDWDFYLDIINIYNRQNIINYDYYVTDENTLGREGTTMFPILPTIGFNVRF